MAPSSWLKGTVKSVLSGDTLVIMGVARGAAPPEKQITLASLKAPRLGRRDGQTAEEPFAWKSREFLRKKVIGQSCIFRVDYKVEQLNNREFGMVFLGSENLALCVVQNGWAKVNRQGSEKSSNFGELERAEEIAKKDGLGVWSTDEAALKTAVRTLPGDDVDVAALFDRTGKGNVITGIVEYVRNGSSVRLTLLPGFESIIVSVAGVQAPSMNRRDGGEGSEQYAPQAKFFTECRILNREVSLVLQGLDRHGEICARILYQHDGNEVDLGKELLRASLARTMEWGLSMMTGGVQELHAIEREAKEGKRNIWTDFVPAPSNSDKLTEIFKGTVVEVTSGDSITVLDSQSNAERRVQLSSLRAPRMGTQKRPHEDWAVEAKEFLRKLVVGRPVNVRMEYNRKITPQSGTGDVLVLMFGNVTFKNSKGEEVNVAEIVVENGFSSLAKHRTDEERSSIYDRLLAAEEKAKTNKAGMHCGKEPPKNRINDVSNQEGMKRAKEHLGFLERNGKMQGIVEACMSGHRMKIMIPRERLLIAFALAGIKAPMRAQPAREGQKKELKGEPYGEEALRFTRHHLLQREVTITVEACDRGGTFLGTLLLAGQRPFDLGLGLLEKGLASLHFTFDESRPGAKAHIQAETNAKEAKIGIWENYTEQVEETEEENGTSSKGRREGGTLKVAVTHIVDGSNFYIQKVNETKVHDISQRLAGMSLSEQPATGIPPSKGSFCLAKFTLDNQWYRGYVTGLSPSSCEIYFIDFGNSESLPPSRVLPIDPELSSIPPQAHACQLAYLKVPSISEDCGYDAASLLDSLVGEGRECDASIVGREKKAAWGTVKDPRTANPTLTVILTPVGETKSVNALLLEAGLAKLPNLDNIRNPHVKDGIRSLQQYQEVARKQHKGLFVYGDPGDSDEEDLPPLGAKK